MAGEALPKGPEVYSFTEAKSGKTYIGQSENIAKRIEQHGSRVEPGSVKVLKELPGSCKAEREVHEQRAITAAGGVKNLANIRNPIGAARQHLMSKY